jgi:phenylpyruvate tautomerase PptA (4-oxalocrotonate tautomerase family)
MPHVIIILWPGKSEEQKCRLAEEVAKSVTSLLHYDDNAVSVAMEESHPINGPRSTSTTSSGVRNSSTISPSTRCENHPFYD